MTHSALFPSSTFTTLPAFTARWPYVVAGLAGFAAGGALLAADLAAHGEAFAVLRHATLALGVACALLGVAWFALLRHGPGMVVAALGSFTVAGAVLSLYVHGDDVGPADGAIFEMALAAFAFGLAATRTLLLPRVLAVIAFVGIAVELWMTARGVPRPRGLDDLGTIVLALAALVTPASMMALRMPRARDRLRL